MRTPCACECGIHLYSSYFQLYAAETETWFIDSFEEWRKAKNLSNFVLLGHSFGGYVAAKYALKVIFFTRKKVIFPVEGCI